MLDYVALFFLIFVVLFVFYAVIVIHDIPYEIAHKRNHPHQDAIHVAGWVSLLTLHIIWPFLWIWATLYREDIGWGMKTEARKLANAREKEVEIEGKFQEQLTDRLTQLTDRISDLEKQLAAAEARNSNQDPKN